MPYTEVLLSDGKLCRVERLGIFDLDGRGPEIPGLFRYSYTLSNGQEVSEEYDATRRSTPPAHPGVPDNELIERSPQWWALLEWETYKASIAHDFTERIPVMIDYVLDVSRGIVKNAIDESDLPRIQTEEDWDAIYEAAIVPQVTMELLAVAFRENWDAEFNDMTITEAMVHVTKGVGKSDSLRQWEMDAMAKFGFKTESEWADLSLGERVRKTASVALPQLLETLATDRSIKEMERKSGK